VLRDEGVLETLHATIPASARWVFADDRLVEAVRVGRPLECGLYGHALRRLLRAARPIGLGQALIVLIGAAEAGRLLWRQSRRRPGVEPSQGSRYFVGFGARAEESIFATYQARHPQEVARIDQGRLPETGTAGRPSMAEVWMSLRASSADVRAALRALPTRYQDRLLDFLTTAAKRIGSYAYARAWWRDVSRGREITDACFLAASHTAFAAIAEGIPSSWLQHGLLSRNLELPEFNRVYPLTRSERDYLRERLPAATVLETQMALVPEMPATARRMVIASGLRPPHEMMQTAPLIRYLAEHGVATSVRPFAGEELSRFWSTAQVGAPFDIVEANGPFDRLLDQLRPMFVASWGSTALAEALYRGILPICVAAPDDRYVNETVYPLFQCSLRWPDDHAVIHTALTSPEAYAATVERLRSQESSAGFSAGG
jgi:hypothetical protein